MKIRPHTDMMDLLRPISVGLGREPDPADAERLARLIEDDRGLSAFDGDDVVGSAAAYGLELTLPGGSSVAAAGVALVGVLPTHRRRGVMTALMERVLFDARAREEPVSILWPSEERIYRGLGYGMASLGMSVELPTSRAGLRDDPGPQGQVQLVEHRDAHDVVAPIYEMLRPVTPGLIARNSQWWSDRFLSPFPDDGQLFICQWEARAYALYRVHLPPFSVPDGEVRVVEAFGATVEATREIWRYLLSLDLVTRVRVDRLPTDHPLVLTVEEPRRLTMQQRDGLWLRVLDLAAALRGRVPEMDGAVVLEVVDALIPENGGVWLVDGDGATRSTREPDVRLDIQDIASVYLGQFTLAELVRAGRAVELRRGGAVRGDALFSTDRKPWCPEVF